MADAPQQPRPGPTCDREDALAVLRRLREAGHVAYFAGGCVRDLLLGLAPKDYDVATDAPPQRVRELFPRTQAVGAAFGVILVKHRRSTVEVATFRSDGAYADGRRPSEVTFTTAEEDAKRRDFTINGLFLDPLDGDRVIDYVGGQADLKAMLIRAIGDPDRRFEEDHLRLLRAIRFEARLDFRIESHTGDAIRRHAPKLVRVSPERIADELRRTLPTPNGGRAWFDMVVLYPGLSDVIFRFLGPPPSIESRHQRGLIFGGPRRDETWPFGLCLAAAALDWMEMQTRPARIEPLLEPASIQWASRALRQSLRISNEETEQLEGSLAGLAMLLKEHPPRVAVVKRFLARPTGRLSRQLLRSLVPWLGYKGMPALQRVRELEQMIGALEQTDFAPPPLVTGDDLAAAGLKPGPVFKRVLDEVYDAQLEGRVSTKEQALALGLQLATSPSAPRGGG